MCRDNGAAFCTCSTYDWCCNFIPTHKVVPLYQSPYLHRGTTLCVGIMVLHSAFAASKIGAAILSLHTKWSLYTSLHVLYRGTTLCVGIMVLHSAFAASKNGAANLSLHTKWCLYTSLHLIYRGTTLCVGIIVLHSAFAALIRNWVVQYRCTQ